MRVKTGKWVPTKTSLIKHKITVNCRYNGQIWWGIRLSVNAEVRYNRIKGYSRKHALCFDV
jgi:hypothetical protein